MNLSPLKDLLTNLCQLVFAAAVVVVISLCVAIANQRWFEFSDQTSASLYVESEFVLRVEEDGRTVYEAADGVSENLKENLLSTVYPSPELAEDAGTEPVARGWWWPYLEARPAEAHANNVCTTRTKVSLQTGGGRHITKHRYDRNGYRYTRTDHQALTQSGYQTYDVFQYRVDKRYCY